jgi:predicted O-methyltransferase YrrM
LQNVITPFPATVSVACEVLASLSVKFDLIYVDASHNTKDARNDVMSARPLLFPGGLIFGHDINWPPVKAALAEWPHTVEGDFWIMA